MPVDNLPVADDLTAASKLLSNALKKEVTADTYERWFQDLEIVLLSDSELVFSVPGHIHQLWIESNFMNLLRSLAMLTFPGERTLRFTVAENAPEPADSRAVAEVLELDESVDSPVCAAGINPRNTFGLFVVGANNQYAHAACLAVAGQPGKTYNPLFIHGGVGLGKTHLMHAIGHQIAGRKKGGKVLYVTSEVFTNDFIDAIQNSSLIKFRKRYRHADVLLIDDIQFLAGKERSQEEFFHTFNTLFDGHKQIVLSSDRPPSELADLETRLVSRFDWGLTAELQPPDVETRVAILRKKAESQNVRLSPEILLYIAERVRTNVRRLEGALTRVASYASLSGQEPTIEKIEHLLKDILQEEARRAVTIEQIQRKVAEHYDVRIADMTSKRRPANIAYPRQVAMYLARELTKSSLSEIGNAFGGRDHGTVLHAHRLVRDRMRAEEKTRQTVSFLERVLYR